MTIDLQNPTPLYRQIAEDIERQIASGELKPGDKIASQVELAQSYSVSLITVKKAIAELVNKRILFSRVGKGTFVAETPAKEAQVPPKSIGLVLRDLKNPYFSLIVQGVEEKASELGYNLLLSSSADQEDREETQIAHFQEIGVRGMIIASMGHHHQATSGILQLQKERFPFIMVSYVQNEDISYIGTDHVYGARIASEHLIKLGYKRIGYINSEEGDVLGNLRLQGYEQALKDYEYSLNKDWIYPLPIEGVWNQYQAGYQLGLQFAELQDRPDAIFAFNDLSALGFEQAVLTQGLKVPEDVAIVGFDDIERNLYAPVPLTTVRPPTSTIGALAVETLVRMTEGSPSVTRTFLRPELVIRDSCGANLRTTP
ncbi:MAG: GntR family transcriptional regulator [Fidelibacterota bacterium]|nr:MAG: GntR family transcriptional regulator [Candidatus Neomarinimicrobiota bacterium]